MTKKLLSISFLIMIALYMGAGFLFFLAKKYQQKKEMKAYIAANPNASIATHFHFTAAALQLNPLHWEEVGEEFWQDGALYDVVRIETTNGITHITALKDSEELSLIKQYSQLHQGTNKSKDQQVLVHLTKLITTPFLVSSIEEKKVLVSVQTQSYATTRNIALSSYDADILYPPPQSF